MNRLFNPTLALFVLSTSAALLAPAQAQFVPVPIEGEPVAATTTLPFTSSRPLDEALLQAVKSGDASATLDALQNGAVVDARDGEGKTPLMWAADAGRADLVKALLEKGAQAGATDNFGRSALHYVLAMSSRSSTPSETLKPRKKKGLGGFLKHVGKSIANDGLGAVTGDALKGQLQGGAVGSLLTRELGKQLLSQNLASLLDGGSFDLSNRDAWGAVLGSALSGAKDSGALQRVLSGDLSQLDAEGWVSLLSSAGKGNPKVLEAMTQLGPAVDAAHAQNWNHFLDMASRGNGAGVREMIEKGDLAPLLQQATAGLAQAADTIPGRDGGVAIVRALIGKGADVSLADKGGQTALQWAQQRGLTPVVELLKAADATPQAHHA